MTEIYERVIDLIKTYPTEFWIGLISLVTIIVIVIQRVKRKNKKEQQQQQQEAGKIKLEAIREAIRKFERVNYDMEMIREVGHCSGIEKAKSKAAAEKTKEQRDTTQTKAPESKPTEENGSNINEPEVEYSPSTVTLKQPTTEAEETIDELPEPIKEEITELPKKLFINYNLDLAETTETYAVLRFPRKGCIVRSHRYGKTKRRGYKETSFQSSIDKYFCNQFEIAGNVRINTGKDTRPFEPDIAIIEKELINNIRIDIEIDEPYAGLTRQPTHCKGEDILRDTYFVDRGWIVIRFSEYQVHRQEMECLKFIAQIINKIDTRYSISEDLITTPNLKTEKLWDIVQAQKWEKGKYRENYLKHTFKSVEDNPETIKRDFNNQEIEEEKLVKATSLGIADKGKNIGFNKSNKHNRDKRISFYSEQHIYTIDGVPTPSASTIISRFFPEFDSAYWSAKKAPSLGMTATEVAEMWAEKGKVARDKGTFLHEQIEKYYLEEEYSETEEFHQFKNFVNDHSTLKPYRSEWRIFDEQYQIAGTIDLVAENNNGFDIYDWKRSKKVINTQMNLPITSNSWQSGIGKLNHIDDTSFNRYCLQQSLYRYILENNYKISVNNMYLVVMYPDFKNYYKVKVPYMRDEISYMLKTI